MQAAATADDDGGFGLSGPAVAVLSSFTDALAGFDGLPVDEVSDDEVRWLLVGLEVVARRLDAARVGVLAEVERRGLHSADGHASAKVMVRHACRLSGPEAARRARAVRVLRDLPEVAAAYRAGEIGADQVDLIGRIHANPRVREPLAGFQTELVTLAAECSYPDFEVTVRQWERLADADGALSRAERAHQRRDCKLRQDPFDLSWRLTGSFGPLQGARINDVLKTFIGQEWEADWAEARATHGEAATAADVARTDAQRAADALAQMAERAAATPEGADGPVTSHTVVWDADTYLATAHRVTCTEPGCGVAAHRDANRWYDPATYRCETLDGHPLEPVEALIDSFHHHLRTVLVTEGVPTRVGSRRRLFTGRNRLAVKLQHHTCIWPGCWVPASDCQADHTQPHAAGGPTEPGNGAPLCGRHNRWKQKGYTTGREPDNGRWRTYRPDGTEIP